MKKGIALILTALVCLTLWACGEEKEPVDYTDDILGLWYVVEYENEYVEFRDDGVVADTFGSDVTYGDYIVDNENAVIWVNFGDDYFTIQIKERDGKIILLDNNGTLVREADITEARAEYQAEKEERKHRK